MARVLILCGGYPDDLSSGADLRFQNLCKQLASRHECYFVGLGDIPEGASLAVFLATTLILILFLAIKYGGGESMERML